MIPKSSEFDLALAESSILQIKAKTSFSHFVVYTMPEFKVSWHNILLMHKLQQLADGKIRRLMVFMPPRHGKSELVSRRFPAFMLGKNPEAKIIGASYGADLASMMNRDVQRIIDSEKYRNVFPETNLEGADVPGGSEGKFVRNSTMFEIVNHAGYYKSAGVGGAITGVGSQYASIDDPVKNQAEASSPVFRQAVWDWYTSTLYTRLEEPRSILVTMTRWHEDDLAGRLLQQMKEDPTADKWEILNLPARCELKTKHPLDPRKEGEPLWPENFGEETLNSIKSSVGTKVWESLYQQRPTAETGNIVKRHWFKYYSQTSLPKKFDEVIQVWDLTFKEKVMNDFVVGTVWGRSGADVYLLDMIRERMDFPKTLEAFQNMTSKWPQAKTKIVEDKANGPALIATLKSKISGIIPFNPQGSKEERLYAVTPQIESGNVYLPDKTIAPWIDTFLEEVVAFPNAPNDDCVDNLSMALLRMSNSSKRSLTNLLRF